MKKFSLSIPCSSHAHCEKLFPNQGKFVQIAVISKNCFVCILEILDEKKKERKKEKKKEEK